MITLFLFAIGFVVVAWGQPHISSTLSLLASGVGFALFWVALLRVSGKKKRFIYGSVWFFFVELIQLSWIASPTYQGTYIYFVYFALCLWLGIQFGVLSLFLPQKAPIKFRQILGIAAFWTLMEWGRLFILCGFAWNPVGLSMTGFFLGMQLAAVVGIFGLSFFVMVVNLLAVNFFIIRTKESLFLYVGFFLFPYFFGAVHVRYHENRQKQKKYYHAALIQTALLPDQKQCYSGKEERYVHPVLQWHYILNYLREYRSHKLDLIVLPEYAVPFSSHAPVYPLTQVEKFLGENLGKLDLLLKEPLAEKRGGEWFISNALLVQTLADQYGAEVVIGLDAEEGDKNYNAAFHFIPNEKEIFRHEKRILLPLAEYLPFSFLKPFVARYGILNFFTHGKETKMTQGKYPMSLSVCYEECFPYIMREGRRKGAKIFVNITNDGWYPYSHLPNQHFIHGRVRAVENGIPLIRACNTGITAGVDSLGRTIARFEKDKRCCELERGALYVPLNLYSFSTLYTFWGDGLILILSFGSLVFLKDRRENSLAEKRSLT